MKKVTEIIDERQLVDELHRNWKTRGYTDGGMAELLEITSKTIHYLGFKLYLVREDDEK